MSKKELERHLLSQLPKAFEAVKLDVDELSLRVTELRMHAEELKAKTGKPFTFSVDPVSPLAMIHAKYVKVTSGKNASELVCPVCGEPDKGNKVNGKPWCLKCNVELVPRGKVKKMLKKVIRVVSKSEALKRDLKKINPGLYPEGEK